MMASDSKEVIGGREVDLGCGDQLVINNERVLIIGDILKERSLPVVNCNWDTS
jgi:hypothetical protein